MKILNLSLDRSLSQGNQRSVSRMVDYARLVDRYTVIVPAGDRKIIELSDKAEIYGIAGSNKIIRLINCYKLAATILRQENYDVISVQDQYYLALIGLRLAKRFKIGLELQIHGFEKYYGLRKLTAKYVLPRADAIRTVSQKLKQRLQTEFKIKEDKISVVPIFVDTEIKIRNFKEKSINDKFIFLTISRLVPVKNVILQIKAVAELTSQNYKIELRVIGEGPERARLETLIDDLSLTDRVKLFGWQTAVDKFYEQADVFLLTSDSEGWPLVLIEAAGFGLPIIMTDTGSAGEFFVNNDNCLVIGLNDLEALAAAMKNLMADNELRKKLGERAMNSIKNLPSKEQTLKLYLAGWQQAKIKPVSP